MIALAFFIFTVSRYSSENVGIRSRLSVRGTARLSPPAAMLSRRKVSLSFAMLSGTAFTLRESDTAFFCFLASAFCGTRNRKIEATIMNDMVFFIANA